MAAAEGPGKGRQVGVVRHGMVARCSRACPQYTNTSTVFTGWVREGAEGMARLYATATNGGWGVEVREGGTDTRARQARNP